MPRTIEQNDKIKLERSNDILAASLKLFSVVGFKNVSVDLITNTVDCSHGLFYHYFTSVDDVFEKVLTSASKFDFVPLNLKEIASVSGFDGLKMIAEYLGSENVFNEAFLCYAKILIQESGNKLLQTWMKKECSYCSITELLVDLIKNGQKSKNVIDGDPLMIANCIEKFLLCYVNDLASCKRKDRKTIDSNILVAFISK